jgi:hypothetical protein
MKKPLVDYLQDCVEKVETYPQKSLLDRLGELVSQEMKTFVRNRLRTETITLLNFYKQFPILKIDKV